MKKEWGASWMQGGRGWNFSINWEVKFKLSSRGNAGGTQQQQESASRASAIDRWSILIHFYITMILIICLILGL
jgi:hypothetical protein